MRAAGTRRRAPWAILVSLAIVFAAIGFGLGTALLKLGWVDCENWDLYAVLGHHEGRPKGSVPIKIKGPKAEKKQKRTKPAEASATSPEDRAAAATRRFQAHLESGSVAEAYASYDKSVRTIAGWKPLPLRPVKWMPKAPRLRRML